ncbi:MAG: hypothetical protein JSS04_10405 [Proteobacteria bacterium]|nr:hypothetical protein [Pseudomonadota bacterium]
MARPSGAAGRACWSSSRSGCHPAARAYFDRLGYRGLFVWQGRLNPIDRFSVRTMQDQANLPSLTASLTERQRFGRYVYNFIFLPPHEPESTIERMTERLRSLASQDAPAR